MKNQLGALAKKQEGGFLTKDLTEPLMENHIDPSTFLDTTNLISLIAVVGKYNLIYYSIEIKWKHGNLNTSFWMNM